MTSALKESNVHPPPNDREHVYAGILIHFGELS